jgi:hypothetical protein
MSRRAKHRTEEIMMVPFLDILCSLIGVLVLIIVVLVVAQTQRINGRTPEELQLAQEYLRMVKIKQDNALKYSGLTEKLDKLSQVQADSLKAREAAEKLGAMLKDAELNREKNKDSSEKMKKELDDLLVEIRGLTAQEPELAQKVAELKEALAKLQAPENKERSVMVNPQGSGLSEGVAVFFADLTADKITYYWNETEKSVVSAVPEVIVADASFNKFLEAVRKIPQSKLILLTRDDGMRSYNLAAGWAQSKHGYPVTQLGKLPVPGRGELDMKLFRKFMGKLPAPPVEKKDPPAPNAPPAAPPAPAPAAPAAPAPPKP